MNVRSHRATISVRRPTMLAVFSAAVIGFTLAPLVVVMVASLTSAGYISFPPVGLSLRWYEELLQRPEYIQSFGLSAGVSVGTSLFSTALGTSVALGISRYDFPGRSILAMLFLSPLMLPTVVIGLAMLIFLNSLAIPRSVPGLILGHVIITLPFVIRLVGASLAGYDRNLDRAAQSLGAPPWRGFWRVTLPNIRGGVIAGAVLAAIVSFDDVNVALFMTSSTAPTLPVRMFAAIEQGYDPFVLSVSSVMIILVVLIILVLERFLGIRKLYRIDKDVVIPDVR